MNDEAARQGRPDDYRDRAQRVATEAARPGLRPFRFLLVRGDEILEVTFYGASESAALKLTSAWSVERGWTVEGSA